ncbi:hypothetical protein CAS74_001055 [Pichia kudriavzevii]|uniref:Protein SGT1 n=2 Tax=Pichia kudriavzevii TaxID=4909 RepID=A0A1V2LRE4_PICKU|nr:uncharacterized protein C5L36_0C10350 [Pichia kudriavzevii]AWU77129.1 hypothetical protein C5L36_0C10350 [Pichia kudriavzevii]ONH76300.1 Protein SGT1 [Pichia kudriavzevii]OUT24666.1 hypothetical protein CAS74_001055 [Pichia kudriavzevii]
MAISDSISIIEKHLEQGKLAEAESELSKILDNNDQPSFKVLILESQLLLRKQEYLKCSDVTIKALRLAYSNGKREQISESLKILSMLNFRKKDYENAFKYIVYAISYDDSAKSEIQMLKGVIENKYRKKIAPGDTQLGEKEREILKMPLTKVLDLLSPSCSSNLATSSITTLHESEEGQQQQQKKNKAILNPVGKQDVRFDWFDSGSTVEISIYVKRINENTVKTNITPTSLDLSFTDSENKSYHFQIPQLYDSINVNETSYKVYGTKLALNLVKNSKKLWTDIKRLEGEQDTELSLFPKDELSDQTKSVAYPTSSSKKIDWSKFEVDDDEDAEGDGPDAFFKKLYEGADENARRAMMKSFIESNGTTLSTDWGEVGNKTIEPYKDGSDLDN